MKKNWERFWVIVAGLCAGYFSFSSILWILYFAMPIFKGRAIDGQAAIQQSIIAIPCFFLMFLFWMAAWQATRRRNIAKYTILLGIILAVFLFWYDLSHERYQGQFFMKKGDSDIYLTWWFVGFSK